MKLFEDYPITRKPRRINHSKGNEVKNKVLPHTQAKLDLYRSYLDVYLSVLQKSDQISRINLYDIYCGNGVYDDGKPGSPIISLESIQRVNEDFDSKKWQRKAIKLTVNDGTKKRFERVKSLLTERNNGACEVDCRNLLGEDMLQEVCKEVKNTRWNERNLIFIDPYGYKEIHISTIKELMDSKKTEIYLFLPIAQMHRFSQTAVQKRVNNTSYEPLRRFIREFLPDYNFDLKPTVERVFEFINAITTALTFSNTYFSCSHYIQRDLAGNYYAIFFVSNNLYGLDRMLNAKWSNDKAKGEGFRIINKSPLNQLNLGFNTLSGEELEAALHQNYLQQLLISYMSDHEPKSNVDLYLFILKCGYLSKHASPILKELCTSGKAKYTTYTNSKGCPTYLNWDDYRKPPKCTFQLVAP